MLRRPSVKDRWLARLGREGAVTRSSNQVESSLCSFIYLIQEYMLPETCIEGGAMTYPPSPLTSMPGAILPALLNTARPWVV